MTFTLWMTGLPCSGKSTIASRLHDFIPNLIVLDGDEVRELFDFQDFSKNGILENNKRVACIARLLKKHNMPVCISLVSPYSEGREIAKKIINDQFIEVYIKCSLQTCEKRDVKGLYKKARSGRIKNFLGIDNRFETPQKPDLILDTENNTVDECVNKVMNYLKTRKYMIFN